MAGFEPTTSWSQTKRDTGLRYTPKISAEREGFEPSVPLPVRQFSKLFLSASQASLRTGRKGKTTGCFSKGNFIPAENYPGV